MSSALVLLRNKFADEIEEILQCPVCYTIPSGTAPVCVQGHFVCTKCKPQMANCPLCQGIFIGTRNYAVEAMAQKFSEIKLSLIDPSNAINKVISNKICIGTQTDANHTIDSIDVKVAPAIGKGKYSCRINNCTEQLPHGRMLPHLRYYHNKNLIEEQSTDNGIYTKQWREKYSASTSFDKAVNIPNMGLFFLKVYIDDKGSLCGNLQIVNTVSVAQQFKCKLEVGNGCRSFSFKGPVLGCGAAKAKLNENIFYANNTTMMQVVNRKLSFLLSIIITRK